MMEGRGTRKDGRKKKNGSAGRVEKCKVKMGEGGRKGWEWDVYGRRERRRKKHGNPDILATVILVARFRVAHFDTLICFTLRKSL